MFDFLDWIDFLFQGEHLLFSINISYYLGLHADNSLHSFPLSGLFILNEVFGILQVFNEASKLYIELFPSAGFRVRCLRGSVGFGVR